MLGHRWAGGSVSMPGLDYASSRPFRTKLLHRDSLQIKPQGLWNQKALVLLSPTQRRRGKTVNMTTSHSKLRADTSDGGADCVSNLRLGISSMSLGAAEHHSLHQKLSQAAAHGFKGIEIFYPDLEALAEQQPGGATAGNLVLAAQTIRQICTDNMLEVISLQPFMFYDGLVATEEHNRKLEKLKLWFGLAKALGTDLICIPSNTMQDGVSTELNEVVNDMVEVAEMGLAEDPVVRFAYENLAWSTVNDTWEGIWKIVQKVDRPNFGMILDTFNIAGRVWADPTAPSGKTENADRDLAASLDRLVGTVDASKVFLIQVIDGEKLQHPLTQGHPFHVNGHPSRMDWSRNARLFPLEESRGAYLPVLQITEAIVGRSPSGLGYKGWLSMELFSRTTQSKAASVPEDHAERGIKSWRILSEKLSA